jgi:hypothetical protein
MIKIKRIVPLILQDDRESGQLYPAVHLLSFRLHSEVTIMLTTFPSYEVRDYLKFPFATVYL